MINVAHERCVLMDKTLQSSKEFFELKFKEHHHFIVDEVIKVDGFYEGIKTIFDALFSATCTLI